MVYSNRMVTDNLRRKVQALEDQIVAIKNHWFNEVPAFSMPFLDCQDEAVQKYVKDMTKWGDEFAKILEAE